ncbi:MAG: amylo-alpha-1,6-glucosidase, partial [Thermodesulfobacteria bacterium]|nr:amylo-alpha-1,6-glucosidase [Thermodesulfobacteriota bacterium]
MKECVIKVKPQKFYILATSPGLSKEALVLKHGDSFALFDPYGDVRQEGLGEQGLYHCGTRFLSRLELRFCHVRPFLLSSSITRDNLLATADLTNPDLMLEGEEFLPRGSLHILRQKFLYEGVCYEAIRLENFSPCHLHLPLSLHFGADFVDIFEVRGVKRKRRGETLPAEVSEDGVTFAYRGLDGRLRRTRIVFSPRPSELDAERALFWVKLGPKERLHLYLTVACLLDDEEKELPFARAYLSTRRELKELRRATCALSTSNEQFNAWLSRSFSDIFMMLTRTPYGLYPYAGIPWFNTVFGRDGLITALECLWINPDIARGVLRFLAATQARDFDPSRDAEPGKILHEMRLGEMAETGEIPFGRYYGTIDATPLFVVLAGAYYERTHDLEFIREIWPNVEAALTWMERYGDLDGDGFLEYQASEEGLVNKGWKDSHDSVFYETGEMARPPIALVEVQAYAYLAYLKASRLAQALGRKRLSENLLTRAANLKDRFSRAFWDEELGTFVLALDGEKRPCRVRTSNAGHVLLAGLADDRQAALVTRNLFAG